VKASFPSPTPNPIPQPVTKSPKLPQVTATKKNAKNGKAERKTPGASKKATVKPKNAANG
jgi:hypothetical protein